MLKFLFAGIVLVHGLIHAMGFAKAFQYGNITQLTREISKPAGSLWLFTTLLFVAAASLFLLKKESWPYIAVVAVILSQVLIISVWKDAKFGTIANLIILLVAIAAFATQYFEKQFRNDVRSQLQRTHHQQSDLLTEADIQHLPPPVQKYLHFTGAVNQPKLKNMKIVFEGEMRSKGKGWFPFRSVQYNFFEEPTRLFFMKAKMFGIMVPGYHDYQQQKARMNVKLFGLFPVMQAQGPVMDQSETVTYFNDICLLAPAALIDKRIEWTPVDSLTAKAVFHNGGNSISATLYFAPDGALVNFISDDRTVMDEGKQYRFSTPAKKYIPIGERKVLQYGEAVWHYPEGEFVYGKFNLKTVEYNVTDYAP
jgi:hypothetical protein